MFGNPYETKPKTLEIDLEKLPIELTYGHIGFNYDPTCDCLFICIHSGDSLAPNSKMLVTKIRVDKWTIEQFEVANTSGVYLRTHDC